MPMLFWILTSTVVIADLHLGHPGRSIVRDDQRMRAEQLAKRNEGTDGTAGVSFTNLMGRATEARKHEAEAESEAEAKSEGRRTMNSSEYGEEEDEGTSLHFQTPDEKLKELEDGMPGKCDKTDCKTHYQKMSEILGELTIPDQPPHGPVVPIPDPIPPVPTDPVPGPVCCQPVPKIDLTKLITILVEIGRAEENVWKQTCATEKSWTEAVQVLEDLKGTTPAMYTGPTGAGGDAGPTAGADTGEGGLDAEGGGGGLDDGVATGGAQGADTGNGGLDAPGGGDNFDGGVATDGAQGADAGQGVPAQGDGFDGQGVPAQGDEDEQFATP
jgi:hypothetical protein